MSRLGRSLWRLLCLLSLVLGLQVFGSVAAPTAQAEPWLSTRFAQNCAGCHAPGRKNLKAKDRRCTLSCQGCHVNPNGGGLRSTYGKWNEDRWLRSFRSDVVDHAKSLAPTERQHYGRGPKDKVIAKDGKSKAEAKDDETVAKDDANAKDKPDKKKKEVAKHKRRVPKSGYPLIEVDDVYVDEGKFKRDGREFEIVDMDDFMTQVPQSDPLRDLDLSKTDAGADIRWQFAQYKRDSEKSWSNFLMDADFGLRWRPLHRNLHFVYESRAEGSPSPNRQIEATLQSPKTRSLYAMVDNLPYNTFVMGGYYRPLFGNFVPDHYALAQQLTTYAMTGQLKNYNILFNAISVGTAPNVPYLNVHVIQKIIGDPQDKTKGIAANIGMRFVTLGASANYSYWRTADERVDKTTGVEMHSFNLAARFSKTVTSIEAVSVSRDVDVEDFRQGGVYALDTYTQLWRENYFTFAYSMSNVALDLKPGSANQIKTGVRSFVIPGLDLALLYETTDLTIKDEALGTSTKSKMSGITGQAHVYF